MALIDTVDQTALAASVRQLAATHAPMARVRQMLDTDMSFDRDLWRRLAQQGLAGIAIPEAYGGGGGSFADLAAALRELGSALVPSPLVASAVTAAHTLLALDDDEVKRELLPQIASGQTIATLATSEIGADGWIDHSPATAAVERLGGVQLDGVKRCVLNGAEADVLVVHAREGENDGMFLVRREALGLTVAPDKSIDATTAIATVTLTRTPATRIHGDASRALSRAIDFANVAMACMQTAAMKRALQVTVDYAKIRYSFGQPIGSYQGVKHKLADIYMDWCLADAATRRAVESIDNGETDAGTYAAAARVLTSPAYVRAAKQMMMLHGGIGFTWDHDAHLFYRNAVSGSVLLGDTGFQRRRLARLLGVQ